MSEIKSLLEKAEKLTLERLRVFKLLSYAVSELGKAGKDPKELADFYRELASISSELKPLRKAILFQWPDLKPLLEELDKIDSA